MRSRPAPLWPLMLKLGAVLLLTALVGLGAGLYADAQFGTRPLLTLILSLAGIVIGSWYGFRLVARAIADAEAAAALMRARLQSPVQPTRAEE